MRYRSSLVVVSMLGNTTLAQVNPPRPLPPLGQPGQGSFPGQAGPQAPLMPPGPNGLQFGNDTKGSIAPQVNPAIVLPYPENLQRVPANGFRIQRRTDTWQLLMGFNVHRDFGNNQTAAEEALKAMRELRPTEWGTIGSNQPVIEYGLTNGKPESYSFVPRWSVPVDLLTVRAEQVRGVWLFRDDANVLANFGTDRAGAEQAAAVARRYGFNRLGMVGFPTPLMSYFFFTPEIAQPPGNAAELTLARAAQEQTLQRTGIPVPGHGFIGERLVIDSRKVEVRKDRGEWVLAHNSDILGRFGASDWVARDALRVVRDGRFTEFCTIHGMSFFLVNGQPPTRVPFAAQGTSFNASTLQIRPYDNRFGIFENRGRVLFSAPNQAEAEQILAVIRGYQFDQLCQIGTSDRASLKFLAKTSGR